MEFGVTRLLRSVPLVWMAMSLARCLLISGQDSVTGADARSWAESRIDQYTTEPAEVVPQPEGGFRLIAPRWFFFSNAIVLDDVDQVGGDDFLVSANEHGACGQDDIYGFVRRFSGSTGLADLHLGTYGFPSFDLENRRTDSSDFLLIFGQIFESRSMQFRRGFEAYTDWQLGGAPGSFSFVYDAGFLSDLDGDGRPDVVAAGSWTQDPNGKETERAVRVSALSNTDGRSLWARYWEPHDSWAGINVLDGGDFDRDGIADPAILVQSIRDGASTCYIECLSGTDGHTLSVMELPDQWYSTMTSAGDLDRDGYDEILLDEGRAGVVCLRQQRLLNPARVWTTAWATAAGDLDGDGWEELVVARVHPSTGEKRISVVTAKGMRDEAWPSLGEQAWAAESARVGDFDGDSLWDLLLVVQPRNSRGGHADYNEIWVTAGR